MCLSNRYADLLIMYKVSKNECEAKCRVTEETLTKKEKHFKDGEMQLFCRGGWKSFPALGKKSAPQ